MRPAITAFNDISRASYLTGLDTFSDSYCCTDSPPHNISDYIGIYDPYE